MTIFTLLKKDNKQVNELFNQLSMIYDDANWKARVAIVKEAIARHVKEEERTLFPDAKKILNKEEVQRLIQQLELIKAKVEAEAASKKAKPIDRNRATIKGMRNIATILSDAKKLPKFKVNST